VKPPWSRNFDLSLRDLGTNRYCVSLGSGMTASTGIFTIEMTKYLYFTSSGI
jgi:hypothetical protein